MTTIGKLTEKAGAFVGLFVFAPLASFASSLVLFLSIMLKTKFKIPFLLFLTQVWQDSHLLNILFRCWRHRDRGSICTEFFCVCDLPLPARGVRKGGVDDLLRDW